MIISHYSQAVWDGVRWPNFRAAELACRHCGQFYDWPDFVDRLQWVRTQIDRPMTINSAHRCYRHNLAVGGAPLSQHKKLAADISLRGHDKAELARLCKQAGFKGFGYYNSFLHIDMGRPRAWYGSAAAKTFWNNEA